MFLCMPNFGELGDGFWPLGPSLCIADRPCGAFMAQYALMGGSVSRT